MNLLTEYLKLKDHQKTLFIGYLLGYTKTLLDEEDIEHIENFIKELKK